MEMNFIKDYLNNNDLYLEGVFLWVRRVSLVVEAAAVVMIILYGSS